MFNKKLSKLQKLVMSLVAKERGEDIGVHQLARNVLPMHQLVLMAFAATSSKRASYSNGRKTGAFTGWEIYEIIISWGCRATQAQVVVALNDLKNRGVINGWRVNHSPRFSFYPGRCEKYYTNIEKIARSSSIYELVG